MKIKFDSNGKAIKKTDISPGKPLKTKKSSEKFMKVKKSPGMIQKKKQLEPAKFSDKPKFSGNPNTPPLQKKKQSESAKYSDKPKFSGNSNTPPVQQKKQSESAKYSDKPKFSGNSSIPLVQHIEGTKWFEHQFDEIADRSDEGVKLDESGTPSKQNSLLSEADALLKRDTELYEEWYRGKNKSDANWLENVANRGTFADRLSVVQLKVQRSPVHALPSLVQLIGLVEKKGLRESASALKVLKELFIYDMLPPNRKLIQFRMRPVKKYSKALTGKDSNSNQGKKRLIMWRFEEELKHCYETFVRALEIMAGNAAEGIAYGACATMADLLCERPEQEQMLLTALVNKLGHPSQKIGSKISQLLEKLVEKHSNMRTIVVTEVKRLIFRKNISEKAQFYGVHFLRRILLSAGEADLAFSLIQTYLSLFRIIIAGDQPDHKLLPLLIAGVNKAFPYAKGKTEGLVNEVENLYTLVQTSKLPTALNVLKLLFQIHNSSEGLSDRFYSSFYRRLLTINSSSLDEQLFGLLLKLMKNDGVESRVRAFMKRLLQVALSSTSAFAASSLLICGMVVKERPELLKLPNDAQLKQALTVKSESSDLPSSNNISAANSSAFMDDDESEDENEGKGDVSGWIHRKRKSSSSKTGSRKSNENNLSGVNGIRAYDPTNRNPLFASADLAFDVEIVTLAQHYHPTVAAFAKCLIDGRPIAYDGDPLVDFSSMRFLDRFAFKNPKDKSNTLQNGKESNGTKKVKAEEDQDLEDLDLDSIDDIDAMDVDDEEDVDEEMDEDDEGEEGHASEDD